jgi:hypothetical protein
MDLALGIEPALLPDIWDRILPASTIPWFAAVKAALNQCMADKYSSAFNSPVSSI